MVDEERLRSIKWEKRILDLMRADTKKLKDHGRFVKVDCPACNSSKYRLMFRKEGCRFLGCKRCRTVFVSPRPDEEALRWYYTQASWSREFAKMLKAKEVQRKEVIYVPRARLVIQHIKRRFRKKAIKVVEVGAGTGGFLEVLREMNPRWRYTAVEPGSLSASFLRKKGFRVIEDVVGNVDKDDSGIRGADVVLNFELIEHLFDPCRFAKEISSIMKRGSVFMLTTPNYHGFDFLGIGREYKNITPPNHITYFNPRSIEIILKRASFKALDITTPGLLDTELVRKFFKGRRKTGNGFLDFVLYETGEETLSNFQDFLRENRLSGHMFVAAEKI